MFKCGFCGKEFDTAHARMEHEVACYKEQDRKQREEIAKNWERDKAKSWEGVLSAYANYREVRDEYERKFSEVAQTKDLKAILRALGI